MGDGKLDLPIERRNSMLRLKKRRKLMSILIKIERAFTVALILVAGCFALVTILARYLLGVGFPWSDGIFVMLTVWGGLMAGATVLENRGHINMDAVINKLPNKLQRWVLLLADLLTSFFLICLFIFSMKQLVFLFHFGGVSLLTYLPAWIEFIGIPISLLFMIVHAFAHVVRDLKGGE